MFLESPHQVDMKNVVKCYKHFFGYFNALKTHSEPIYYFFSYSIYRQVHAVITMVLFPQHLQEYLWLVP